MILGLLTSVMWLCTSNVFKNSVLYRRLGGLVAFLCTCLGSVIRSRSCRSSSAVLSSFINCWFIFFLMLVDVSLLTKGFLVVLVIAWIAFLSIPFLSPAVPSNVL